MRASVGNRIVLIDAGDVGVAYAYPLVNQGLADHLAIIDTDRDKLVGEVMDLGPRSRVGTLPHPRHRGHLHRLH